MVCQVNGSSSINEENMNPKIGHRKRKKAALMASILMSFNQMFTAKSDTGTVSHKIESRFSVENKIGSFFRYKVSGNIKIPPNSTCHPFMAYLLKFHFFSAKYTAAKL